MTTFINKLGPLLRFKILSCALPVILLIGCIHTFNESAAWPKNIIVDALGFSESVGVKVWLFDVVLATME